MKKYINKLKAGASSPNGENQRPPVYVLFWGEKQSFPCVITSLSYKLDMFLPDGTPVRALVDISLQEVDMENPPGTQKSNSKGAARSGAEARSNRQNRDRRQPATPPRLANPTGF